MLKKVTGLLLTQLLFLSSCAASNLNNNGSNYDNQNIVFNSKSEHVKGNLQVIGYSKNDIIDRYSEEMKKSGMTQQELIAQHIYEDLFVKLYGTSFFDDWSKKQQINIKNGNNSIEGNFYLFSFSPILNNELFYKKVDDEYEIKNDFTLTLNFTPYDNYLNVDYSITNFGLALLSKNETNTYNYEAGTLKYNLTYRKDINLKNIDYGATFDMVSTENNLFPTYCFTENEINNLYIGVTFDSITIDLKEEVK